MNGFPFLLIRISFFILLKVFIFAGFSPSERTFILDKYGKGCYLLPCFTDQINKDEVKLIFEIGSRDAVELSDHYKVPHKKPR